MVSSLEESFYRIPPVIVRDLAYLPEHKVDKKHQADEEKIVNLSERFRKSINHLRRFSYANPSLRRESYTSSPSESEIVVPKRDRRNAFSDLRKVSNYVKVMPI